MTPVSKVHGRWLRQQRQAQGWSVPEMRRRLREAAQKAGDNLPGNDCLSVMIRRWESDRSGVSERYRLYYCRAFHIPPDHFGVAAVNGPLVDGLDGCDLAGSTDGRDMSDGQDGPDVGTVMMQLCGNFLTSDPEKVPGGSPLVRQRLQTTLGQPSDPARRHELCFLLGYMTALITTAPCAGTNYPLVITDEREPPMK